MRSRLPPSWGEEKVLATLSIDCQQYLLCSACEWEQRVDSWGVIDDARERRKRRCTRCGRRKLSTVAHRVRVTVRCADCGADAELVFGAEPRIACPQCGSERLDAIREPVI